MAVLRCGDFRLWDEPLVLNHDPSDPDCECNRQGDRDDTEYPCVVCYRQRGAVFVELEEVHSKERLCWSVVVSQFGSPSPSITRSRFHSRQDLPQQKCPVERAPLAQQWRSWRSCRSWPLVSALLSFDCPAARSKGISVGRQLHRRSIFRRLWLQEHVPSLTTSRSAKARLRRHNVRLV